MHQLTGDVEILDGELEVAVCEHEVGAEGVAVALGELVYDEDHEAAEPEAVGFGDDHVV